MQCVKKHWQSPNATRIASRWEFIMFLMMHNHWQPSRGVFSRLHVNRRPLKHNIKGAQIMAQDWMDISLPMHSGMVHWPDNPPVSIERALDMGQGDAANVSKLSMGVHTGTHMDAPIHFFPAGKGIDTMPLTAAIGRARVIEISDAESIKTEELSPHQIQAGERILFKTRNSSRCWQTNDFVKDFVYISSDAAQYLAEQKVQTVGVDYLSVG